MKNKKKLNMNMKEKSLWLNGLQNIYLLFDVDVGERVRGTVHHSYTLANTEFQPRRGCICGQTMENLRKGLFEIP